MTELERLKRRARSVARARGHYLSPFRPCGTRERVRPQHAAVCARKGCGATAVVNTSPAPNDIDVSGTAVALNCQAKP